MRKPNGKRLIDERERQAPLGAADVHTFDRLAEAARAHDALRVPDEVGAALSRIDGARRALDGRASPDRALKLARSSVLRLLPPGAKAIMKVIRVSSPYLGAEGRLELRAARQDCARIKRQIRALRKHDPSAARKLEKIRNVQDQAQARISRAGGKVRVFDDSIDAQMHKARRKHQWSWWCSKIERLNLAQSAFVQATTALLGDPAEDGRRSTWVAAAKNLEAAIASVWGVRQRSAGRPSKRMRALAAQIGRDAKISDREVALEIGGRADSLSRSRNRTRNGPSAS